MHQRVVLAQFCEQRAVYRTFSGVTLQAGNVIELDLRINGLRGLNISDRRSTRGSGTSTTAR